MNLLDQLRGGDRRSIGQSNHVAALVARHPACFAELVRGLHHPDPVVRMRAAENARWILRATNDGITAVVDPAGRVTDRLEPYKELAATIKYNFTRALTPYVRFGDWFAWSCLAIGLAGVLWSANYAG